MKLFCLLIFLSLFQTLQAEEKVSSNGIIAYLKSIFIPDRSADIPEKSCTEININTVNMPNNRHQGNLNWCFAYTAADLLSFHEELKVSAYDIALQNHNEEGLRQLAIEKNVKNFSLAGGWPVNALLAVAKGGKGVCLEEDTNFTQGEWEKLSNLFADFSNPEKDFISVICDNKLYNTAPFKEIPADLLEVLKHLNGDQKILALLDVSCNRHQLKNKYGMYSMTTDKYDPLKLMGNIDGLLKKGLPISVSYASDMLKYGVKYKGKFPDHASTIIGRKFNKSSGQCEYLLRNSWGTEGKCRKLSSIRCENGDFWVPRTALKNNISEVMWMEKKPKPASLP